MSAKYLKVSGHLGLAMCAVLVATTASAQKPTPQLVVKATTVSHPTVATFAVGSSADTLIVSGAEFRFLADRLPRRRTVGRHQRVARRNTLDRAAPFPARTRGVPGAGVSWTSNHAERELRRRCGGGGGGATGPKGDPGEPGPDGSARSQRRAWRGRSARADWSDGSCRSGRVGRSRGSRRARRCYRCYRSCRSTGSRRSSRSSRSRGSRGSSRGLDRRRRRRVHAKCPR